MAGSIRGLVALHPGYPFSGQTAAAAYRQIRGLPFETVVILAPSHKRKVRHIRLSRGSLRYPTWICSSRCQGWLVR
ncbi:MAG TPA: AmmeMemoRadiSam system protein B [Candidatus Latescibacteria bacterium]|nr:AmmeMemoRadiSam system protein B [Gemmatimonadota bacterium]HCR16348.1 AmmeMemoRadiSam system protein B [Candidatus Latescibacterota bacterium]